MESGKREKLSTVQHRGETQIPAPIRSHLELREGDVLDWTVNTLNEVVVRKVRVKVEPA